MEDSFTILQGGSLNFLYIFCLPKLAKLYILTFNRITLRVQQGKSRFLRRFVKKKILRNLHRNRMIPVVKLSKNRSILCHLHFIFTQKLHDPSREKSKKQATFTAPSRISLGTFQSYSEQRVSGLSSGYEVLLTAFLG